MIAGHHGTDIARPLARWPISDEQPSHAVTAAPWIVTNAHDVVTTAAIVQEGGCRVIGRTKNPKCMRTHH